jgi:hypothetical protein
MDAMKFKCKCPNCGTLRDLEDYLVKLIQRKYVKGPTRIGLDCWYCNFSFWVAEKDLIKSV